MKYSYLVLFLVFNAFLVHAEVEEDTLLPNQSSTVLDSRSLPIEGFSATPSFREGDFCATPVPILTHEIDLHRSLLVHDVATLSAPGVDFSLQRTLSKIAHQVTAQVPGTTAESIFQQMWDTQNESANAILPANTHCDDNGTTINGYPQTDCPRAEGEEASLPISVTIDEYQPTALVNRIDLAHKGWKNCGEHRIIYAKKDGVRKNLMIFEAVLPNPKPGCRSGCRDVIEFWVNLSNDSDSSSRATQLQNFFYQGLPGFSPVVHVNHYSASATAAFFGGSNSGQIRTNQFLQFPWLLKEFKTLTTCSIGHCEFDIVPISVKGNPYGELWNNDIISSRSPFNFLTLIFQAITFNQVTNTLLGHSDINQFSYAVDSKMNAADSVSQAGFSNTQGMLNVDNYRAQLNASIDPSFRINLNLKGNMLATPLTANQIVNRATALSCAGCHKPDRFGLTTLGAIGSGQRWPDALAFVHVDVDPDFDLSTMNGFNPVNFNGNTNGFNISSALLDEFLPTRNDNLVSAHNKAVCNCEPIEPLVLMALSMESQISNVTLENSPGITKDARQLLALADEKVSQNPSKKEADNSFQRKREIIKSVEKSMMQAISRQPSFVTLQPSDQALEQVAVSGHVMKDLSAKEKYKFKLNLANDLDQKFPQRETVTGSFRTH